MTTKENALSLEIAIARAIAIIAHHGQTTKSEGLAYVTHCAAVADRVSDELKPTAWLHDVLEDTPVTIDDLAKCGISQKTIVNVLYLTRTPPYDYAYYIKSICTSGNVDAMVVKLADLDHNLRPSCSSQQRKKYEAAAIDVAQALAYWTAEYARMDNENRNSR